MKTAGIVGAVAVAALVGFGVYMIDVDVTGDLEAPDVSVNVEGGELPEVSAETGDISVGQSTVEVEVPEVEVTTQTEEVTVPTLNITPPEEDVAENQN